MYVYGFVIYTYLRIIIILHIFTYTVRDVYSGNTQIHYAVYPVHAITKQNTNKIAF